MSVYKTKQRKLLSDFFKRNSHQVFTASNIVDYFLANHGISSSTIYRNLSSLESAGEIRQVFNFGGRETYYQYIDREKCKNKVHLLCSECHESIHMDNEIATILNKSLLDSAGFMIDANSTVIYGICENCRKYEFYNNK